MPYALFIGHKIKDFAEWKAGFDEGADVRKAGGMKSYQIFHLENDPNNLMLLCEFDNLDDARKFVQSKELQEAMQHGGVIEVEGTYLFEEVEKGPV